MEKEITKSVETYTMDNVEEVIRGLEWRLGAGELQSFYTLLDRQPFSGQFEYGFITAMAEFKRFVKHPMFDNFDVALKNIGELTKDWQDTDQWHCSKGASAFLDLVVDGSKGLEDFLKFVAIMAPMREEARKAFFDE